MSAIYRVDQADVPWFEYQDEAWDGPPPIRVKPLTRGHEGVPPVQFVEYAAGHEDPMHSHDTDEIFLVVEGEIQLEGISNGPGNIVFVPRDTQYAVKAGPEGARYYRIVTS
jgi:quercetin dioxygenase-like cupin family protein